jgi:hypothetical protein
MPATLTRSAFEAQVGDRRIVRLEDWSENEIRALESMVMEPGHESLNAELTV